MAKKIDYKYKLDRNTEYFEHFIYHLLNTKLPVEEVDKLIDLAQEGIDNADSKQIYCRELMDLAKMFSGTLGDYEPYERH